MSISECSEKSCSVVQSVIVLFVYYIELLEITVSARGLKTEAR